MQIACTAGGALRGGCGAIDGAEEDRPPYQMGACALGEGLDAGRGDVGEGAGDIIIEF